jgi:hypothetical protein
MSAGGVQLPGTGRVGHATAPSEEAVASPPPPSEAVASAPPPSERPLGVLASSPLPDPLPLDPPLDCPEPLLDDVELPLDPPELLPPASEESLFVGLHAMGRRKKVLVRTSLCARSAPCVRVIVVLPPVRDITRCNG